MAKNNGTTGWAEKQVFTTGEAAEICKVSQQTIIRCFDSGRLQGFRVPGSRFRRIPRAELLRFMKSNEIPTDALESMAKRVLIVDDDESILELFRDVLNTDSRFEIRTASTGYDAGLMTEQFKPHLIILDFMLPDINGNLVCERVKANPDLRDAKVLIVSGVVSQDDVGRLMKAGADGFVKKPFDIAQLVQQMEEMLQV
jgi:excisionase family DNA binding protein